MSASRPRRVTIPDHAVEPALRLFVALELSEEWRRSLESLIARMRQAAPDSYRWVKPQLLHLTLLFLGWQRPHKLPAISEAVEKVAAERPRFRLELGEPGSFGGRRPRVLWVATVDRASALSPLRARLETEMAARGIVYDPKPLVPHITLARAAGTPGSPAFALAGIAKPDAGPLSVDHIALLRSELRRDAPRYTAILRAPMAGARP